jgi:hypothetical protein
VDHYATWAVLLLPYLEQDNLYREWDIKKEYYQQTDLARQTPVPTYFCPSRRSPRSPAVSVADDVPDTHNPDRHFPGAVGDYACSLGYGQGDYWWGDPPDNGAFQYGTQTLRFASITDGLSNTIFVGEKHVQLGQFGRGADCSTYNGDHGCSFRWGGPGYSGLARSPQDSGTRFGSYHPGLCQFVMGDGSVRVLPNSIAVTTLGLLTSRNDGQTIPDL